MPVGGSSVIAAPSVVDRVIEGSLLGYVVFSVWSIALSQGFGMLACGLWLLTLLTKRGRAGLRGPLWVPQVAFFVLSWLMVVAALDPGAGVTEMRAAWFPVALFFLCVNRPYAGRGGTFWVRLLIGLAVLAAGFGIWQAVTHGSDFRIRGSASHYMTYAGLLLLVQPLALAQLLFNRRGKRDGWIVAGVILLVAALLLTQTRSGWLGLLAGWAVIVALWKPRYLLALPLVMGLTLLIVPGPARERLISTFDTSNATTVERLYMWKSGVQVSLDYPLTGVGPGGLRNVYTAYKDPDDPWLKHRKFTHLHDNLLQIAAERGLPAVVLWIMIWVAFFWRAIGIYRRLGPRDGEGRALVVGGLAAITGFLVMGVFEYNYGDTEVMTLSHFVMALPFVAGVSMIHREGSGE